MGRQWKFSLAILFFGGLTFLAAVFLVPQKRDYFQEEILGTSARATAFVEPDEGREPLLARIRAAQEEILVTVYLLSDEEIISSLVEKDRQGLPVRVLLEERPFGGAGLNPKAKARLEEGGVEVKWTSHDFVFTHQKSIVFDQREVCVLNLNLTTSAFSKNREYAVCAQGEPAGEAKRLFETDWKQESFIAAQTDLVISPVTARGKLESLLKQATRHVEIVMEVVDDPEIVRIITELAGKGVAVRLLLPPPERLLANRDSAEKIARAGGWVKKMSSPYVHAKLIIVDGQRAYAGSVNLTTNSMDNNRELGIIVSQQAVVARFQGVFENDWSKARDYE